MIDTFKNGESNFFIGVRNYVEQEQNIIAVDYSRHIGFRPFTHTSDVAIKTVLTGISTEKGYRGSNKDKCVHFDTNAQTLIFDNNKHVCDTGVGTKPIYENI